MYLLWQWNFHTLCIRISIFYLNPSLNYPIYPDFNSNVVSTKETTQIKMILILLLVNRLNYYLVIILIIIALLYFINKSELIKPRMAQNILLWKNNMCAYKWTNHHILLFFFPFRVLELETVPFPESVWRHSTSHSIVI